jgi:hypothetical protein
MHEYKYTSSPLSQENEKDKSSEDDDIRCNMMDDNFHSIIMTHAEV